MSSIGSLLLFLILCWTVLQTAECKLCDAKFKIIQTIEGVNVQPFSVSDFVLDEINRIAILHDGQSSTIYQINLLTRKMSDALNLQVLRTSGGFMDKASKRYYLFGYTDKGVFLYAIDTLKFRIVLRTSVSGLDGKSVSCAVYNPQFDLAYLVVKGSPFVQLLDVSRTKLLNIWLTASGDLVGPCSVDKTRNRAVFITRDSTALRLDSFDMTKPYSMAVGTKTLFYVFDQTKVDNYVVYMQEEPNVGFYFVIYDPTESTDHAVVQYLYDKNVVSVKLRAASSPAKGLLVDTVNHYMYVFGNKKVNRYKHDFKTSDTKPLEITYQGVGIVDPKSASALLLASDGSLKMVELNWCSIRRLQSAAVPAVIALVLFSLMVMLVTLGVVLSLIHRKRQNKSEIAPDDTANNRL